MTTPRGPRPHLRTAVGLALLAATVVLSVGAPPASAVAPRTTGLPAVVSLCQPGTYSATGSTPCTPAAAGHFVAVPGATSQTACAQGAYQPATGQVACLLASAGYYQPGVAAVTQYPCGPGSYQPSTGQAGCIPASPGHYVSGSAAVAQAPCDPGTFRAGYGAVTCASADPGSYVPVPASATETACAAGTYSAAPGSTACTLAGIGSYVATTGATAPTPCPAGTFTLATGSTSAADCVALALAPPGDQTSTLGTAVVGLTDSVTNEAGTFTWSATGLPAGLTVDPATGTVSGTPTTVCDCAVTLTAVDPAGYTGSTSFTWHVRSFRIVTTSLASAVHGQAYGPVQLEVAGVGASAGGFTTTVKWGKVSLPRGLKVTYTGMLHGTPSKALVPGAYPVTVKVTEKVTTLNGTHRVRTTTVVQATLTLTIG
jgi:hypothetical protein